VPTSTWSNEGIGVAPVPQIYAPSNNTRDVAHSPVIQVLWSEPLNPATLGSVYLQRWVDGSIVPTVVTLNTDPGDYGYDTVPGRIMTITPQETLATGGDLNSRLYYYYLPNDIQDTDGDVHCCSRSQYFYTAEAEILDDRAPDGCGRQSALCGSLRRTRDQHGVWRCGHI
jgi:hypothetical protein